MRERKTQYQRNRSLRRAYRWQYLEAHGEYLRRLSAWQEMLKNNPPEHVLVKIADLLARLGFEPNEHGVPHGNWPPITKTDPLVLLDAMQESVGKRPDGLNDRQNTLAWKADVLEAATLVWAGVIEPTQEQIQEVCPRALLGDVWLLLQNSDLEAFWNRPGVGWSAADIRQRLEQGKDIVTVEKLQRWLSRARGYTLAR